MIWTYSSGCNPWMTAVMLLMFMVLSNDNIQAIEATCELNSVGQACINPDVYKPKVSPPSTLFCGLYMGPSTLGESTNLGMYTGMDYDADETIKYPEIAIPLMFREWDGSDLSTDDGTLWDRYIWEGEVADLETHVATDRRMSKSVFVPGIGCTINSILEMNNVESTHGSTYDTVGIHRATDPGAGAFTPYTDALTTTTEFIPAGSEIFASYGDTWIPEIPGAQVTNDDVMDAAEEFLRDSYRPFVQAHDMSTRLQQGLWEFTKNFPTRPHPWTEGYPFTVLPRKATWQEVDAFLEAHPKFEIIDGETANAKAKQERRQTSVIRHFVRQDGSRSIDWLNKNARCCDHIRPGKSTIPQAGRGAFSTRDLPQGTIVAYSPLIHVGRMADELFNITYEDHETGTKYHKKDLVINYSFGHKKSSIILTPYGSMVNYINHDKERANVRVVWPSETMIAHDPEWLNKDADFLRNTLERIGLSFDYVALRDIAEGEEIFMDYGDEWERAWKEHVEHWEPPPDASSYVHSTQFNEDNTHLRTLEELQVNPYPPNLQVMCDESYYVDALTGEFLWMRPLRKSPYRVPCRVLARHEDPETGKITYRVEMETEEEEEEEIQLIEVDQVERRGIYIYDKVQSNDWHLQNAFRHEIMIPDDIFPASWMNL